MSASYDNNVGFVFAMERIDPIRDRDVVNMLNEQFDRSVIGDIHEINEERIASRQLRKISLIRTIVFPVEAVLTRLLLGKAAFKKRLAVQKATWLYLRRKIDRNTLLKTIVENA